LIAAKTVLNKCGGCRN